MIKSFGNAHFIGILLPNIEQGMKRYLRQTVKIFFSILVLVVRVCDGFHMYFMK